MNRSLNQALEVLVQVPSALLLCRDLRAVTVSGLYIVACYMDKDSGVLSRAATDPEPACQHSGAGTARSSMSPGMTNTLREATRSISP